MNLEEAIAFIRAIYIEYVASDTLFFRDYVKADNYSRPIPHQLEHPGSYVIYEGNEVIYVGSAGKGEHYLKYRIADLFFYNGSYRKPFKHTLTRKLLGKINRFHNINEVSKFYLEECTFKMVKTNTIFEARLMEATFTVIFNPKYND